MTVSGSVVKDKDYDETTDATVILGTVSGIVSGDDVVVTASGSFPSANSGIHECQITYSLSGADASNYVAPANQTVEAEIMPAMMAGLSASANNIEVGEALDIQVTGTKAGDVVSYIYAGTAYSDIENIPISEPGSYTVMVQVSRPNYRSWSKSVTFLVVDTSNPPEVSYHYVPTADGDEKRTSTKVNLLLMPDNNETTIPERIPFSSVHISGDAVLNTEDEYCPVLHDSASIPIRMVPKASGDYYIDIQIDLGNSDTETKRIPAYFMSGYWGCYPCQLNNGATEPTADQIVNMVNLGVLTGSKVSSVSCTFGLSDLDWNAAVEAYGITGDDADIYENGCGYTFFITCWDDTEVGAITNELNIPQNAAFNPFVITINGVEYRGVVSKNCEFPSGTSPYTVNLN